MSTDFSSQPSPASVPPPTNKMMWMLLGGVIGSVGTCGFCLISPVVLGLGISLLGQNANKTFSNVASAIRSSP